MKKLIKYIDNCWDCPYFIEEWWGEPHCDNYSGKRELPRADDGFIEPPEWCKLEDMGKYGNEIKEFSEKVDNIRNLRKQLKL